MGTLQERAILAVDDAEHGMKGSKSWLINRYEVGDRWNGRDGFANMCRKEAHRRGNTWGQDGPNGTWGCSNGEMPLAKRHLWVDAMRGSDGIYTATIQAQAAGDLAGKPEIGDMAAAAEDLWNKQLNNTLRALGTYPLPQREA